MKKKHVVSKLIAVLFIIIVLLCLVFSIYYYIYVKNTNKEIMQLSENVIKNSVETLEYGSTVTYEDIVNKVIEVEKLPEGANVTIKINDTQLNPTEKYTFTQLGETKIDVSVSLPSVLDKNIVTEKQSTWKIEDNVKPELIGVKDKEVTEGDKIDVKEGISAKDDIDGQLNVTIEGVVDTNKPGTYTLTAKAIDKNNNEVSKSFKVVVKEKKEEKTESKTNSKENKTISSNNKTTTSNKKTTSSNKTSSSSKKTTSSNKTTSSSKNSTSSSKNSNTNSASTKSGRLSLAKAEAKRVVNKIIKSGMTKKQKAEAIFDYLGNVETQHDQSTEAYKKNYGNEAYAALILKKAACSGFCKAVTLMCDYAGLTSKHINANQWTHQWNLVQVDNGKWVVLDAQGRIFVDGKKHPYFD